MVNARQAKSAREKAAEMRAEAARQESRRRAIAIVAAVLAVIVVAVGAGIIIQTAKHNQDVKAQAAAAPPANLTKDAYVVGTSGAKVTVQVYEDFQCPACQAFESSSGELLAKLAADGKVKVEYRPVAILDRFSSNQYSSRALNAAAVVINSSPSSFVKFHQLLFANQPPENGDGLPDSQLIDLAVQAGASRDAVTAAIKDRKFKQWSAKVTEQFTKDFAPGGTPTIVVNGKKLEAWSTDKLQAAIDAAAKG